MEITQLRYAIGQGGGVNSVAEIDQGIFQTLVDLRGSSAQNDYSALEDRVLEIKGGVLRREYSYGAELTEEDLTNRLSELTAEYSALQSQTYNAVTQITAPQAGTFSALVDGYETLVSPETALQLTPSGLRELMDMSPSGEDSAAGKLILSKDWYFAAVVTQEEGERLDALPVPNGQDSAAVTLRFASDFTQDIPAKVIQVSEAEDGQAVVVLSANRYLEQTTLLRRQTAEKRPAGAQGRRAHPDQHPDRRGDRRDHRDQHHRRVHRGGRPDGVQAGEYSGGGQRLLCGPARPGEQPLPAQRG